MNIKGAPKDKLANNEFERLRELFSSNRDAQGGQLRTARGESNRRQAGGWFPARNLPTARSLCGAIRRPVCRSASKVCRAGFSESKR